MTLAENVKYYQELKNLTTAEFAAKANLPADTINKIRASATQNPSMDTLKRMAAALECSIDDLAGVPKPEPDVSTLLPDPLPSDPTEQLKLLCRTLQQQKDSHEHTLAEIRRDRNWWRGAALAIMGVAVVLILAVFFMVCLFYWDMSHPTEGNILWSVAHAIGN